MTNLPVTVHLDRHGIAYRVLLGDLDVSAFVRHVGIDCPSRNVPVLTLTVPTNNLTVCPDPSLAPAEASNS